MQEIKFMVASSVLGFPRRVHVYKHFLDLHCIHANIPDLGRTLPIFKAKIYCYRHLPSEITPFQCKSVEKLNSPNLFVHSLSHFQMLACMPLASNNIFSPKPCASVLVFITYWPDFYRDISACACVLGSCTVTFITLPHSRCATRRSLHAEGAPFLTSPPRVGLLFLHTLERLSYSY